MTAFRRRWASVGGLLLCAAGLTTMVATAGAAHAQEFKGVTCHADVTDTQGDELKLDVPQDLVAGATTPKTASAGATFAASVGAGSTTLPTVSNGLPISSYVNLSTTYEVNGGTIVGGSLSAKAQPTINGKTVKGTAKVSGNTVITGIPGPIPPGKLVTPNVDFKIKAGGAGSTVKITVTVANTTANLKLGTVPGKAVVVCPFPANTLATTGVVEAGAPNAVDDTASTTPGKAVVIDVLANDGPNSSGKAPDPATLEVTGKAAHGTTAVADGKITYTPAAGFTGTDSFTYQVCDAVAEATTTTVAPTTTTLQDTAKKVAQVTAPAGTTLKCDPATVTVTVAAEQQQAVTTTVATLPRTGSSSTPLALIGGGLLALGLAALGLARRRPVNA